MALYLDGGPSAYKSAAIRVVKTTDLNQEANTPVLDVVPPSDQKLQAVVNTTADRDFVKVQIWAMAFGTGSTPYLNSFGGTAGEDIPAGIGDPMVANTPRTFGRDWEKVHGLDSADPEIIPLLGANDEFHCCIKANVYAVDANEVPIDGVRLGPSPTIDWNDPRQAQRNMTIKTLGTGGALSMLLFAGSTDEEEEQEVLLRVRERPLERLERLELVELGEAAPWIRPSREKLGPGFVPGLEVVAGDDRFPIRFADRPLDDLELELGKERGTEVKVVMAPKEHHRMLVQTSPPKEDFVLRGIDVAQIEHDEVVGEAHVLLLTAPEELVDRPYRTTRG